MRLEKAGYLVVTAGNGQEGLEQVQKECPDLIVSDVLMPIMDGFTFYKKLKESPSTSDIPVLILTARGHMEDSFRVMGADDFLSKPFENEVFLSKIESLFNRSVIKVDSNKKVLVSGSDKQIVESIAFLLKKMGCLPEMAKDGTDVITKVVQFTPDILIMEVPMLGLSGEEVIKIIRQMAQFSTRPIITYSFFKAEDLGETTVRQKAMVIDDAKNAAMEAGATADIGRFNEHSFVDTISTYLSLSPKKKD